MKFVSNFKLSLGGAGLLAVILLGGAMEPRERIFPPIITTGR